MSITEVPTKRDMRQPPSRGNYLFSESVIQPETIQAYRETEYRVTGEQSLVLRIAEHNESLSRLYISNKVDSCVFITACNPCSKNLSDAANADRHNELGLELQRRGLKFFQGEGKHPLGDWPGEASYLILGLSLEAAKALGKEYEQNAIVWCGSDALPQLVLLK
ncbi:MAG: DUF3293 domain-containing protein [Candidatus Nitrotoga sp.]|nr:DUF3293 domain-containing protein [Candidatus Nitrotoga sp.]